jgi:hypothetical protein
MGLWKRLLNFICFEVGWFACAIGAARGMPLLGPIAVAVLVVLQLPLVPAPTRQVRFVLVATLLGWSIDSALTKAGVLSFPSGAEGWLLCPLWMAALWANFAGALHLCLDWLRGHYAIASILGALGGPLAYYGGQSLGAIHLGDPVALSLVVIAVEWAVVTPGLVYLSQRGPLDGLRPATGRKQEMPAE